MKIRILVFVVFLFLVGCGKDNTYSIRQEINNLMEVTFNLAYKQGAMDGANGNHLPEQRAREYMSKFKFQTNGME